MANNKRDISAFKVLGDLALLSLTYACYCWVRYQRLPHTNDWLEALAVWVILISVRAGYRRIVGELERQNALLSKVLGRLEEQE